MLERHSEVLGSRGPSISQSDIQGRRASVKNGDRERGARWAKPLYVRAFSVAFATLCVA